MWTKWCAQSRRPSFIILLVLAPVTKRITSGFCFNTVQLVGENVKLRSIFIAFDCMSLTVRWLLSLQVRQIWDFLGWGVETSLVLMFTDIYVANGCKGFLANGGLSVWINRPAVSILYKQLWAKRSLVLVHEKSIIQVYKLNILKWIDQIQGTILSKYS